MPRDIPKAWAVPRSRRWIWGNKDFGYAIRKAVKGDQYAIGKPWVAEAWNRRMVSNTYFTSKEAAIDFCKRMKAAHPQRGKPLTQKKGYGKGYWKVRKTVKPGKKVIY